MLNCSLKNIDSESFKSVFPFPHCIIDNFLNDNTLQKILNVTSKLKLENATSKFVNKNCPYEYNKYTYDISKLPELSYIFNYLNSDSFLSELSNITGVNNIIANMKGGIRGSGVHIIKNGGYLGIHTDFNTYNHPNYGKLDRRINILIYLNPNWKEEYGGHLILRKYNKNAAIKDQIKILPTLNRCVIFNTTKDSWHGHEEPLNTPTNVLRVSIANYYYTKNNSNNLDFEGEKEHNTRWWNNNFKDIKGN
jgi:Rps23 Pro-64 3,4-dihydroxylase Tpa1-like proline 4-hydroxylase